MSKIIKCEQIQFDLEKSYYDLASIYADKKLDIAISEGQFDGKDAPTDIEMMEYLAEEFYSSLGYFSNLTEEFIKELVDH